MKIQSLIKKAKYLTIAATLTAFLTLAFTAGPASAAGVGIMKRGGEKNTSSTEKSDKDSSKKAVERSAPSQSSRPGDATRNSPSARQDSPPGLAKGRTDNKPVSTNRDSSANRAPNVIQNRQSQENRTDNRPQREQVVKPQPSQAPVSRPDNTPPNTVQNRPAQQRQVDNRPQREIITNNRDDSASRTVVRPPSNGNTRTNNPPASPQTRVEERGTLGTIFDRGRQEPAARPEVTRPSESVTRTPNADRHRVETPSPIRTDNKPQRVESTTRSTTSSTARVQRSPDRVIERVFETRRDWQQHYKSYDAKWRPQYRGGFYYYRGPLGYDPYYYGYYSFAHVPSYTFPSVYFYYGTFPYVYRDRIVVLTRPARHYVFVTLDLNRIFYDDYYLTRDYIPHRGYVLSSSARQSLRNTLDDIQRAWEHGDNNRLMRHAIRGKRVDVFAKGSYSYSINFEDYRDMTRDAMATIDTIDFEFTSVRMRSSHEVVAYGRHNYYNASDRYATVYVSYTLERIGNKWHITEVGSSPYRFDD